MHDHIIGPYWGNVIIIGLASTITMACFLAMLWMLYSPSESDRDHPKYQILSDES